MHNEEVTHIFRLNNSPTSNRVTSGNVLTIGKTQFIFVNSMRDWTITLGRLGELVARVDDNGTLGLVVLVFRPMVKHPSATPSFNVRNPLDKCHICMGSLDYLGSSFGFNLHNYAVYAHISSITLCLGFVKF